eukprot:g807.t1
MKDLRHRRLLPGWDNYTHPTERDIRRGLREVEPPPGHERSCLPLLPDDPRFQPPYRLDRRRRLDGSAAPWDDILAKVKHVEPPTTGFVRPLLVLAAFGDTPMDERFRFSAGAGMDVPKAWSGSTPNSPVMPSGVPAFDVMRRADEWYRAASGGRFGFSNWTYAHVVLRQPHPGSNARSNYGAWCRHGAGAGFDGVMNDALDQLARRGCRWHYSRYDLHIVVFPYVPGCHGAVAQTPGTASYFNGYGRGPEGVVDLRTLLHELGHNLGLHHSRHCSSAYGCDDYGDQADIMGRGSTHYNAAYMHYLGWLRDEDVLVVRRSGVYRVFPADGELELRDDAQAPFARRRPGYAWAGHNRTRALVLERDMSMRDSFDIREPSREYVYAWYRSQPSERNGLMDFSRGLTLHRLQRKELDKEKRPQPSTVLLHPSPGWHGVAKERRSTYYANGSIQARALKVTDWGQSRFPPGLGVDYTTKKTAAAFAYLKMGETFSSARVYCSLRLAAHDNTTSPPSMLVEARCDWPTNESVVALEPAEGTVAHMVGRLRLHGSGVRERDLAALVRDGEGCRGAGIAASRPTKSYKRVEYWDPGSPELGFGYFFTTTLPRARHGDRYHLCIARAPLGITDAWASVYPLDDDFVEQPLATFTVLGCGKGPIDRGRGGLENGGPAGDFPTWHALANEKWERSRIGSNICSDGDRDGNKAWWGGECGDAGHVCGWVRGGVYGGRPFCSCADSKMNIAKMFLFNSRIAAGNKWQETCFVGYRGSDTCFSWNSVPVPSPVGYELTPDMQRTPQAHPAYYNANCVCCSGRGVYAPKTHFEQAEHKTGYAGCLCDAGYSGERCEHVAPAVTVRQVISRGVGLGSVVWGETITVNISLTHAPPEPVTVHCTVAGALAADVKCGDEGFGGAGPVRFEAGPSARRWQLQTITFRGSHIRNYSTPRGPWGMNVFPMPLLPSSAHQYPPKLRRDCITIAFSACVSGPGGVPRVSRKYSGDLRAARDGTPTYTSLGKGKECKGMEPQQREAWGSGDKGPGDGVRPVYLLHLEAIPDGRGSGATLLGIDRCAVVCQDLNATHFAWTDGSLNTDQKGWCSCFMGKSCAVVDSTGGDHSLFRLGEATKLCTESEGGVFYKRGFKLAGGQKKCRDVKAEYWGRRLDATRGLMSFQDDLYASSQMTI